LSTTGTVAFEKFQTCASPFFFSTRSPCCFRSRSLQWAFFILSFGFLLQRPFPPLSEIKKLLFFSFFSPPTFIPDPFESQRPLQPKIYRRPFPKEKGISFYLVIFFPIPPAGIEKFIRRQQISSHSFPPPFFPGQGSCCFFLSRRSCPGKGTRLFRRSPPRFLSFSPTSGFSSFSQEIFRGLSPFSKKLLPPNTFALSRFGLPLSFWRVGLWFLLCRCGGALLLLTLFPPFSRAFR